MVVVTLRLARRSAPRMDDVVGIVGFAWYWLDWYAEVIEVLVSSVCAWLSSRPRRS